jgi:predicted nucleotidyltransferase
MDAERLIELARPVLAAEPTIAVAWLFGSAARGTMRGDSDVDIGVVFREGVADAERERTLADVASRLEAVTSPHALDLVALESQGCVFAHRALTDGKRIVVNDEERRVAFEADVIVRYLDWKPTWDIAAREQPAGMRRWLAKYRSP